MSASYRSVESLSRQIRPLSQVDLPDVLEIERTCYSFPWSEAVFRDCFQANYRLWGVEMSGALVGYAVVAYLVDEAHLLNICVSRQHRRAGVARFLLRHLMREACNDRMVQLILEVRQSNQAAADLYLSEGFSEIGRRPGYYPSSNGREDARVLAAQLASPTR